MHIKSVPLAGVKAGPDDGLLEGEFVVYPSTFTKEPDSYGDVVAPGAFLEDLAQWKASGNTLPGLFGHRFDDPDFYVAFGKDYGEDEHGWWVKGEFDLQSPKGPHVYRLVKGRRLSQLSFAYDVIDQAPITLEDGRKANELRKLKVHEFSFVPLGANPDTSIVAVKALSDAITDGMKAGRALDRKHITSLRKAQEALGAVIAHAEGTDNQDEKASDKIEAKSDVSAEEPSQAKSPASDEEPKSASSVGRLAAQAKLHALNGAEGGSE